MLLALGASRLAETARLVERRAADGDLAGAADGLADLDAAFAEAGGVLRVVADELG
jgi:hypothetical protein